MAGIGPVTGGPPAWSTYVVNGTVAVFWHELNVREPAKVIPFQKTPFGWSIAPMEGSPSDYSGITLQGRMVAGPLPIG